ncbi:MAG: mycothiol S-conjugate amidase [Candidatus Tectimicrobiota bacterium]|nr:MAG: mycothiol S-conjugate amidase [Candidatus Tectomicrobia bacterium]
MAEPLTLMAVHAHPDDECLSTGGVLARLAREGVRTVVVTATRGEEGEIVDPQLAPLRPRLGEVRVQELLCACKRLQVAALYLLGYRDSGMAGTPANAHPACLAQADLHEATGRLVRLIRAVRPHVLICYDEQGGYGHPDHVRVNRITVAAFHAAGDLHRFPEIGPAPWQPRKLYYTAAPRSRVLLRYRLLQAMGLPTPLERPDFDPTRVGTPDAQITTRVDIRPFLESKLAALRCHRSQIAPDYWFLRLPDEVRREHFGEECFVRVASHVPVAASEDDLFAGLR